MINNQSDLLMNFFQQTHMGKMSLITLMQNLPDKILPTIPEIIYDKNGRYLKLKEDNSIKKNFIKKSIKQIKRDNESINDIIQQRTISVSSVSPIEKQISKLSIEQQYNCIANEFKLSSYDIEKQYKLALKNRIEIPPVLMHRIIIDTIKILYIMIDDLNQDIVKNNEKFQRISKRLNELQIYNKLFDHHC
ncbi:unnamed protein product [Rotaria sordida]|uniref:Uncharacterized protein n=1 Tax=Rotaria sordida TaxID=392033 RepID=A0A818NJF2_9BILA|nr:unnamed protein product [Rotaria sordida]CAF0737047.1 unnamed protein product [Rotaria sordida]CAF0753786.1 unnamed protein product [Rotaria sordida]CAF0759010.1 unnamed protein product [Rotaria sordida]CAF3604820.1 unnamed protein product [Rotaria sordida]